VEGGGWIVVGGGGGGIGIDKDIRVKAAGTSEENRGSFNSDFFVFARQRTLENCTQTLAWLSRETWLKG